MQYNVTIADGDSLVDQTVEAESIEMAIAAHENGVSGHYVRLRRVGVITFQRWRKSANQAADLFEAAVERFVEEKELGTL